VLNTGRHRSGANVLLVRDTRPTEMPRQSDNRAKLGHLCTRHFGAAPVISRRQRCHIHSPQFSAVLPVPVPPARMRATS
jgi:hypothetical protein